MKTTFSIWICKLATLACKLFRRNGTVFPGECVNRFDKNALDNIKYPKYVVVVTGSSGKGSTVSMLAHILEDSGKKVLWNKSGSNIKNAIVTLVLNNTNSFTHEVDADILLLEMDERYISSTFKKGIITHMVITNITRDQPARNIHPEIIYDKIMESVDKNVHLVLNIDDPLLNRARMSHTGPVTTYGIDKTKYSSTTTPTYAVDFAYCPKCHTKLKYEYYHYGHLGAYECPKCDFDRGKPDYQAEDVDLSKAVFKINGIEFKLNKKVFFAVYYTLASYTLARTIGLSEKEIEKAINVDVMQSKRMKTYELDGRPVELIESKNENALSYLQSLNYIKNQDGKKTVIMGFENVSRRYKYNDLSWLWDVNFELLKDDDVDKIFCIGRFKYDVATRLDYADIDKEKIVLVENLDELIDMVEKDSKGKIFTMVCFDMTEIITKMLKEKIHEENN